MEGMRFIRTIRLDNILSFGPSDAEFALEPLNVLIGPNASGKSNLIEVLSLLHAAPRDLQAPIRQGGGVWEWLWKGSTSHRRDFTYASGRGLYVSVSRLAMPESWAPTATIDATIDYPNTPVPLRYRLSFTLTGARFELKDEAIENEKPTNPMDLDPYFYYRYQEGRPVLNVKGDTFPSRQLKREDVMEDQSILSQRRDPEAYPELTYLANRFERLSFYREWNLGRHTPPRLPQKADLQQDRLLEDASNLGLVLNDLQNRPMVTNQFIRRLTEFYPQVERVVTHISGGTVQIFFHEKGLRDAIPATRLSDGSLRYLCLLSVLLHPEPPPVICIEEPELGLHPDIIPEVAKLLIEASSRSQIFVTTHSDVLVDALSEVPEAVVVCEKVDGATQLRRLDAESLEPWLEKYRLGELWTSGRFGGNRW